MDICISDYKTQDNGVPQGEILSVTFFSVAINTISQRILNHIKFSLFADDLVIYYTRKKITTIQEQLQGIGLED